MKLFYILFLTFLSSIVFSGCSINKGFNYVTKEYNETYYFDKNYKEEQKNIVINVIDGYTEEKIYNSDSILISSKKFSIYDTLTNTAIATGESKEWYDNGNIKRVINYHDKGDYDGKLITYHINSQLKREDMFSHGELLRGTCYDSNGIVIDHFPFDVAPIIDTQKLENCLVYPESMRIADIQEAIILKILIDENGKIIKIKYDKHHSYDFIHECIKCLEKDILLKPSYIDGEAVKCWFDFPIYFRFYERKLLPSKKRIKK